MNPRLDLVWTQGMDSWKPAGEIEGLFERRTSLSPTQEPLSPPVDPYVAPRLEPVGQRMSQEGGYPGARRRAYLFAILIFPALWHFVVGRSSALLMQNFGGILAGTITMIAAFVPLVVSVYYGIRRLVNVGMSGWWYLGNFVPVLNIWVGYRSFACPAGYAYHKKLDGAGVLLAIVYWLLVLLAIVGMVLVIALFLGMMGSPDLQRQIHEKIQEAIRLMQQSAAKP